MHKRMKDSGVEWIGQIPEEWFTAQVKSMFYIGRGRVIAKTEIEEEGLYPVYSSQTKNNGVLGYLSTFDFDRNQLTWTTDGANAGTVFLREGKHNCTNVCGTLLPKKEDTDLNYMNYAIGYVAYYNKRADINGFKIMNNEMSNIRVTVPPLPIQHRIAAYLDEKVAHIDNIIDKTKQTIEEYKKYKQSLITEAVTKGLNPDVKMKDSEVEWIGQIPEHWGVNKYKYYLKINNGKEIANEVDANYDNAVPVYGSGGVFKFTDKALCSGEAILFGRKGSIGKVLHIDSSFWTVDTMFYATIKSNSNGRFYYYSLTSIPWHYYTTQTALPSIVGTEIANVSVGIPPLAEQQEISAYLDELVYKLDNLISQKQDIISNLESYKKSLIYEVVTGKHEVV